MPHRPVVRRRQLGAELRRQRLLAGLTSEQAARLAGWHQSKVSRIETGRSAARPADVTRLLDAYDVGDRRLRDALLALAADGSGRGRGWWQGYGDLLPPAYRDFINLETGACRVRTLETSVVPGLLQTPGYAHAVTRAALPQLDEGQVAALAGVRLARQEVLRADPPPRLWAVLDEAVLRRPIGGAEVMAEQLRHLAAIGRRAHVRIQVLPFSMGGHTGLTGPFVIFSFPSAADLDVVVVDHLTNSLYLERTEDIRTYSHTFELLRQSALSCRDSAEFITRIANGR